MTIGQRILNYLYPPKPVTPQPVDKQIDGPYVQGSKLMFLAKRFCECSGRSQGLSKCKVCGVVR